VVKRRNLVRPIQPPNSAFAGFRFPPEIILVAVRWYLRYGLSYRDLVELLAERGIEVDHVTPFRWVQRFTPLLIEAARPCRHRVGSCWFVDETYVKVYGSWRYVYRAVDQAGQVIDMFVSKKRDRNAHVVLRGHAFIQNLRRGHYELGVDARSGLTLAAAFDELAFVI
jgi:transposase-like protein